MKSKSPLNAKVRTAQPSVAEPVAAQPKPRAAAAHPMRTPKSTKGARTKRSRGYIDD
jgi:hypothetical protein